MTALSDTLAAAQVRALAALERAYLRDVAGQRDVHDTVRGDRCTRRARNG